MTKSLKKSTAKRYSIHVKLIIKYPLLDLLFSFITYVREEVHKKR